MTKEQAIEIVEGMVKSYIKADECGISNNDFKHEIEAMQTVLNMLKEKDKEIEKLKKHNKELLRKLRNRVKEVKKLNKYSLYKKEFKTLNEQLKNKDKIIDLIINEFYKRAKISENCYIQKSKGIEDCLKHKNCKDCIKKYFKSKAEKE